MARAKDGNIRQVCIMGLGYIGLPTACIFATKGLKVIGVDIRHDVVNILSKGDTHIYEPDLDILVKAAIGSKKLKVSTEPQASDAFMICVPTPFKDGKKPDLSYVKKCMESIIPHLEKGNLIVLESTSPIMTTENLVAGMVSKAGFVPGEDIYIAYCPERVLPGNIFKELVENDRVIGGINEKSARLAQKLYSTVVQGKIYLADAKTAEMVKLVENAYRDVNIAFANEIAGIADKFGIDVWRVIEIANRHPRVNILSPGAGVGGHCIAVDPWFIVDSAPGQSALIKTARNVNDKRAEDVFKKVIAAAASEKKSRSGKVKVACFGLAYKADVDDLRESPALKIAKKLAARKDIELLVVEPNVEKCAGLELTTKEKALIECDIAVFLVNHSEFKEISSENLIGIKVIDVCGLMRGIR
ncbi:MAG: UDP-N-acetyl-D-mannosamine dehydrogenase [Candidatus Schekmanbacteria bacterium]|nr:UDP-N-acetyl-D-mannosamine dehydrogenase [Candidatus Schekmanbacteria bacterium]